MATPFEVLGIEPTTDVAEIRHAYRRAAMRCHPDRNPGDAAATGRFQEIEAAWEHLKQECLLQARLAKAPIDYPNEPVATELDDLDTMREVAVQLSRQNIPMPAIVGSLVAQGAPYRLAVQLAVESGSFIGQRGPRGTPELRIAWAKLAAATILATLSILVFVALQRTHIPPQTVRPGSVPEARTTGSIVLPGSDLSSPSPNRRS